MLALPIVPSIGCSLGGVSLMVHMCASGSCKLVPCPASTLMVEPSCR